MKRAVCLAILWMVLFLGGCAVSPEEGSDHVIEVQHQTQHEVTKINTPTFTEIEYGYAYGTLDEEKRQLYQEMLFGLKRSEAVELSVADDSEIDQVFECVMADHPELFYVDGYNTRIYKRGDKIEKIIFEGTWLMEREQAERTLEQIQKAAGEWLWAMEPGIDDYSKVKYLYETIIANTDYDVEANDGQNIQSVFLNCRSVCQGYAKAFQFLCLQANIPCVRISGTANGQGHAWTAVQIEGEWYHVDPTWGDAAYQLNGEQEPAEEALPSVNYDYLCVTTEMIQRTHQPASTVRWPVCTSTKSQYYRREGLYLENADLEQVKKILEKGYAKNAEYITFQCGNKQVYQELFSLLITGQKIFDLISADRISYSDSEEYLTFTFWLPE